MVTQEGAPTLAGRVTFPGHVLGNGRLSYRKPELEDSPGSKKVEPVTFPPGRARLVVPKNRIRTDSRDEAESAHPPGRRLRPSICLGRLSSTCSGRGAGLKSRTYFFGTVAGQTTSAISPRHTSPAPPKALKEALRVLPFCEEDGRVQRQ